MQVRSTISQNMMSGSTTKTFVTMKRSLPFLVALLFNLHGVRGNALSVNSLRAENVEETCIEHRCKPASSSSSQPPLKVFLLAGQSNMEGQGSMEHLTELLVDDSTRNEYAHLWDETTQTWAERDDVYCKFENHIGKLSAGYGWRDPDDTELRSIGPELGFGWAVGDAVRCDCDTSTKPKILLLKTAWGGKDLAVDFRPPSSGKGNYENVKPLDYGRKYHRMILDIQAALSDESLPTIVPGYTPEQGYTLEGLVWFQG
jgi:Carbohydrate esterase, sialic acid-specific acetylesterase